MSKRDELIRDIESKQLQKRAVAKKMRPDPLPSFGVGNDYNRSTMYQTYINEYSRLSNDISRLTELVNLLPKENTPENATKRDQIVSSIESKAGRLQDLYKKLSFAQSGHREILNNQISDIQGEIADKKLILSFL